jgi:hypothetical protein
MSSKSFACVKLIVLLTNHFATTQSQNCDILSPIKLSPLDMTLPFKSERFSDFKFDFDKKSPFKISHKTNVLVELSDKNTDKSPTFSGGGICGEEDCVFKFDRFGFNWKKNEDQNFNGKDFPLESHLIFFNQK